MPARATGERTRGSFRRTSRGSLGRRAVRVRERAYAARRRCLHGRPASEREAPSDVRRVARSDEGPYAFGNGPTRRGDDARTGDRRANARLLRTYVAWLARTKGRTSTRSGTGLRGEETMPVQATEREAPSDVRRVARSDEG